MVRAVETSLQELLEGTKQYQVPLYQRPYSWQEPQLQRLWEDIASLSEARRDGPGETHFIGSVVLAAGSNVGPAGISEYLVVDGQQRLTTLSILLCAIRDHRAETEDHEHRSRLNEQYLINKWKAEGQRLKLRPTQADLPAYVDLVDSSARADGAHGMGAAYRFFRRQLAAMDDPDDEGDIAAIEDAVISGLSVVSVTAQSGDNVHRIFESLNNTGMRLTQGDLLRNYIFMRLPSLGEEVYRATWLPMQKALSNDELEFLFWMDIVAEDPRIRQTGIYTAQQKRMDALADEQAVADDVARLARLAQLLRIVLHPEHEQDPGVRARLERLHLWGSTTVFPVLLHMLDARQGGRATSEQLAAAMLTIESFLVRRLVIGQATKALNTTMLGMVAEVRDQAEPDVAVRGYLSAGRKYFATDSQVRHAVRTLPFYLHGRAVQRKQILAWLDEALKPGETLDTASTTIEHVLPQTPTSYWRQTVLSDLAPAEELEDSYQSLVHLIGNLTLTVDNSSLGNSNFERKKAKLKRSRVLLNRDIVDYPRWGRPEILERCDRLAHQIVALWPGPIAVDESFDTGVDWARMDRALASLPAGTWTTYGDLAALIGSHPVPVAGRLSSSPVRNAHRVLTAQGRVADRFRWLDPEDTRDPAEVLLEEGIRFDDSGAADTVQRVRADELADLVGVDRDEVGALALSEGTDTDRRDSFERQIAEHSSAVSHGVIALVAEWDRLGGRVDYGTNDITSAFLLVRNPNSEGGWIWPFAVYPSGTVEVVFQHLARRPPFDDVELRDQFRRRLNDVPGVDLPEGKLAMRPSFPLDVLAAQDSRAAVVQHLAWFMEQVQGADENAA